MQLCFIDSALTASAKLLNSFDDNGCLLPIKTATIIPAAPSIHSWMNTRQIPSYSQLAAAQAARPQCHLETGATWTHCDPRRGTPSLYVCRLMAENVTGNKVTHQETGLWRDIWALPSLSCTSMVRWEAKCDAVKPCLANAHTCAHTDT